MKTIVMGILNVTEDSFSDGGKFYDGRIKIDSILQTTEDMLKAGASIIDVGGESTRPGAVPIDAQTEIDRIAPVIDAIKSRFDVAVSVDTYKASVAETACLAGASIVNDISMCADPMMPEVILRTGCDYVLVHNNRDYVNQHEDMVTAVTKLTEAGIGDERIIVDPGIGFGKTFEQNIEEMRKLSQFCKIWNPTNRTLLGVSNKSFIGNVLDLPVDQRLEGTLATSAYAVMAGVNILRVHNVEANIRVIKMIEALM